MKKKLPIIISAAAVLTITGCLGFAFSRNIKSLTAEAQEYQIEFKVGDIVDELSEMDGTTGAYVYFEKLTPKGNLFGPSDLGTIYGGQGVSYGQNSNIFTISDSYGYGYFSFVFKFNLNLATFDHITFLGSFTTGYSDPATTTYKTFNQLDNTNDGYVTCYLDQIRSATVTQVNVVYHC